MGCSPDPGRGEEYRRAVRREPWRERRSADEGSIRPPSATHTRSTVHERPADELCALHGARQEIVSRHPEWSGSALRCDKSWHASSLADLSNTQLHSERSCG
ncbi:hypothetical protein GCM10009693_24100 [Leucobacter chromiireducens subsp. chromiireducens]